MRTLSVCGASTATLILALGVGLAAPAFAQTSAAAPTPQNMRPSDSVLSGPASAPSQRDAPSAVQGPRPAGGLNTLSEVVVTARRREENLQSVPIAVTALSGAEIAKQNVLNISDLGLTVPGFKVGSSTGNGTAPIIAIRGQVQNDTLPTLDPSVGTYVDGIYWARPIGADAALVDVQAVDILKGPQGTLFGRNTTGGALVINTADPNLSRYSGLASITGGAYGELDGTVVVNAPIIEDKLGVRVAFNHEGHDGYTHDNVTGQRLDSQDRDTFRIKILAKPTEQSTLLLSYENFVVDEEAAPFHTTYYTPFASNGAAAADAFLSTGSTAELDEGVNSKPHSVPANAGNHVSAHTQTVGATGSYDFGFGVLKAIAGFREDHSLSNEDLDGSPLGILDVTPQFDSGEQNTFELQFNGHALANKLQYTAGYYYFREFGNYTSYSHALSDPTLAIFGLGGAPLNPKTSFEDGTTHSRSQAGYFQGTYKLTDALSLTGGVRYSTDHKSLVSSNATTGPGGFFSCGIPNPIDGDAANPADCSEEFHTSSSDVDYTASLDYKITRDVLAYVKVAHGYRAGGLNLRGSRSGISFSPFAPETALNYEAGLKSEFFNHRLRINFDGYYTDYSNIQRTIIVLVSNVAASVEENAAKGSVYGGEFEAQALVYEGLRLGMSLGVIEAQYSQYADQLGDHVNEAYPYTPTLSYSLTGDYTHAVPMGTANFHLDYGWQSTTTFAVGYTSGGTEAAGFPTSSIRQAPYGLLNFRAGWDIANPNLEVAIFGRNVGDTSYRTTALDLVDASLGLNAVRYGAPATYGVQVTYKFGG